MNDMTLSTTEIKLVPFFQPIIGVASGSIVGYEALARYFDANGQPVSAGHLFFDPAITDQQKITWDRQLRQQALQKFSQLQSNCYLSLNISAAWLKYVEDVNELPTLKMLQEMKIDKRRIVIEISDAKGDLDKLAEIVKVYRRHGLKVAVDDFGAGYSQLERVIAIRPDIIKLDMQLFKLASKGGVASDVVNLVTRLAKRTASRVICEGVETDAEFFFGLNCGAQLMQGFLFSPAVPEFVESLSYQRHIHSLRKKFLQRILPQEQKNYQKLIEIKQLVKQLQQALRTDFNLNHLMTLPFEASGILRFYICNNEGQQLSASFVFAKGKWFEDPKQIGFNWSWRPYFYQILALEPQQACSEPMSSESYRDFSTDKLCKTLSIRIDEMRILLVDFVLPENSV
jgi:EAL domain-containing protein (putative c-di-GMP-specific phosphodiesterase class I)